MTDVSLSFEVVIDAPVHTVFEYCRDPRRIYAGDPTHKVADATLAPEGVGTRALVVNRSRAFSEEVAIEYVELVPDQRIAFQACPKMTITGLKRFVIRGSVHTWTWTFAPDRRRDTTDPGRAGRPVVGPRPRRADGADLFEGDPRPTGPHQRRAEKHAASAR